METPYGDTATLYEFLKSAHLAPPEAPILVRVIERPIQVTIAEGEPMDLSRLSVDAPSETRTFILDPDDIHYQDGALWLIVGEQEEE